MILKRLFPQFSTYQSYVAIISNAFSIEVKLLTGDTVWQPQPRYLFERYICFRTRMNVAWNKEQGNDLIEEYFNDNDGK